MSQRNERFDQEERTESIVINFLKNKYSNYPYNFIHNTTENGNGKKIGYNAKHGDLIIESKKTNEKIEIDLKRLYNDSFFISDRCIKNFKGNYLLIYSLQNNSIKEDSIYLFNFDAVKKYFESCERKNRIKDTGFKSKHKGYRIPISSFKNKSKIERLFEFL